MSTYLMELYFQAPGEDLEVEVVVTYDYFPACEGSRDEYGMPVEPDEPAYVEINSVTPVDAKANMLSQDLASAYMSWGDEEVLCDLILEAHGDDTPDEPDCNDSTDEDSFNASEEVHHGD